MIPAGPLPGAPRGGVTGGLLARSIHSGRVLEELRESIVAGALPAGYALREAVLADNLGVSRGPIRRALRELESEGLVENLPNGRSLVSGFTQRDLLDLFAVRLELESVAVEWGITARWSPEGVCRGLRTMAEEGASTTHLVELDLAFHRALVEFAGSRSLLRSWLAIAPVIATVIMVGNRRLGNREPQSDYARIMAAHTPLADAVLAGDAALARDLLARQFAITQSMYAVDGAESSEDEAPSHVIGTAARDGAGHE